MQDQDKKAKRNIQGLRELLWDQIDLIQRKDPAFDKGRAELVIKAADTIMATAKLELAYAVMMKKNTPIEMLEGGKEQGVIEAKVEEPTPEPIPE